MPSEEDVRAELLMDRLQSEGSKVCHDNDGEDSFDDEEEDADMVADARRFYSENQFALFVSMLSGLLSLMYVPSISRVHHAMGTTKSAVGAFRRYLSTINHVDSW